MSPTHDVASPEEKWPTGRGTARGKVILLGEHSAVYGHLALVGAVDLKLEVQIHLMDTSPTLRLDVSGMDDASGVAGGHELLHQALRCCFEQRGIREGHFQVDIHSELPIARGMGSSAALGVANLRALNHLQGEVPSPERLYTEAMEVERLFHGNPSGVDVAAAVHGGLLQYRRANPPQIIPAECQRPLPVVLIDSGQVGSTAVQVAYVAHRRASEAHIEGVLNQLGDLASQGVLPLKAGDLSTLGNLMNQAHTLLCELGVSTQTLDDIVYLCLSRGALGAKLTGSGGGGMVLALGRDAAHTHQLADEATRRGYRAWAVHLGGSPGGTS